MSTSLVLIGYKSGMNLYRQKRLDSLPVASLTHRRNVILQDNKISSLVSFDPGPLEHWKLGSEIIETL